MTRSGRINARVHSGGLRAIESICKEDEMTIAEFARVALENEYKKRRPDGVRVIL